MRLNRVKSLGLLIATLMCAAPATASAFDIEYKASDETLKHVKIERTGKGEDFGDHVAIYLRFIPAKGNRIYPAFINTKNYLSCPDKDNKWLLYQVGVVDLHKRSGITVLGFFFEKPECDNPTYHMDGVFAES